MTIELGYSGDDFVTNSITCMVRDQEHRLVFTVSGFFKYANEIRSRLLIYKALKEFNRLNDYPESVRRYNYFLLVNRQFLIS